MNSRIFSLLPYYLVADLAAWEEEAVRIALLVNTRLGFDALCDVCGTVCRRAGVTIHDLYAALAANRGALASAFYAELAERIPK